MGKILREIEYEELSEILQIYLDKGETKEALAYCEVAAQAGNPYGYMFMAFIYEEGHGSVEIDYKKALCYYKEAERLGCEVKQDVVRLEQLLYRIEQRILNDFESGTNHDVKRYKKKRRIHGSRKRIDSWHKCHDEWKRRRI